MKTDLNNQQTEAKADILNVRLESSLQKKLTVSKGLSLRPRKSVTGVRSLKPKTLLPSYLVRRDEEDSE